jgi:hypothetical protein
MSVRYRCTPLLLADVCGGCMLQYEEDETLLVLSGKEDRQKRQARASYMQAVILDLLTTPSL